MSSEPSAAIRMHEVELPALDCELGGRIDPVKLRFSTWGRRNANDDNTVWICHPLTCDADPGAWWPGLVGPGKAIDPAHHYIVCANAIGSCYGSTGPASVDPRDDRRYGLRFPQITVRDVARALEALRARLGIARIALGIGGSFGGQQLYEWLVAAPARFERACIVAATPVQSPWAIALHETQRMALEADPGFRDSANPAAASAGLAAARALAVLSYRSHAVYANSQADPPGTVDGHRAASYQRHVGERFTRRFDAHSYWCLTRAMDRHDVARGRGSLAQALARISAEVLVVGIRDDLLYPAQEVHDAAEGVARLRRATIAGGHGHDSTLVHAEAIGRELRDFLAEGLHAVAAA